MDNKKTLVNIFSNWSNLLLTILIAFIVSPILVSSLGNEGYGIWVLIVSITGYFTVLDFGVNSAIVRYVSKYIEEQKFSDANQVYNSSLVFFSAIATLFLVAFSIFAMFFHDMFIIEALSRDYIYLVLICVGFDFSINLIFSVYQGVIRATHNFLDLNIISITVNLLKNIFIVIFLVLGHSLITIVLLQISATLVKVCWQYLILNKKVKFLYFDSHLVNRATLKTLVNYSVYSFIISIAIKLLFYTDTLIIGSLINVSEITFYAIAQMIVEHLEKIIWAVIAVLIPIVSAIDARGDSSSNREIYQLGTRYSILLCAPIIVSLFAIGDDFIGIWMGTEYQEVSSNILFILLAGYIFSLSQLIAQGVLKGISRHKILAIVLMFEAVANLILSIILVPYFGVLGVALGTAIPLVVINLFVVPFYTCKILELSYVNYFKNCMLHPILILVVPAILLFIANIEVDGYIEIAVICASIVVFYSFYTFVFMIDKKQRKWLLIKLKLHEK